MEHFDIIKELCKAALETPNDVALRQVTKLKDALEKSGEEAEALSIELLLNRIPRVAGATTTNFSLSPAFGAKEELTDKNTVPFNTEISVPLAEILFTEDLPDEMPLFEHDIEEAIHAVVMEWAKFDTLVKMNTCPSSSFLVHGAPGTGKTHLAQWIAKQIGLPVVSAGLENLMSPVAGDTSRNIASLFFFANRYNCVLLLDKLDVFVKLRDDPQEAEEANKSINAFLQGLDNRKNKGFTIGMANEGCMLGPAIWKRFDIQLAIPRPTPGVVISLLKKFLKPLELTESEIKFIGWCLEDSAVADVEAMARWITRSYILDKNKNILNNIRQFALLNSKRMNDKKREIILHRDKDFIRTLIEDKEYSFEQVDITALIGTAASSTGRLKPEMEVT